MINEKNNPDWEQRRYEVAKEILVKNYNGVGIKIDAGKISLNKVIAAETIRLCVEYADIFIDELRKDASNE